MNDDEVSKWIQKSSFLRLENRVLKMNAEMRAYSLNWARDYLRHGGDRVKMKWAVAIGGTLAPEELEAMDDDDILSAEIICDPPRWKQWLRKFRSWLQRTISF